MKTAIQPGLIASLCSYWVLVSEAVLVEAATLASCLIYARAFLEYVNLIVWVRFVNKTLPSVKFAEYEVLTFYRAACNADAVWRGEFCPSVCLSVCLSVRPSVTRVIPDKTKERSVQIFIPYERTFILVF